MYEHKSKPLISRPEFLHRLVVHSGFAGGLILFSLLIGVVCYHALADLPWIDALLNASMILGGEGPVDRLESTSAKVFASFYALYAGLVLLVSVGILFAPILHRILHKLHLPDERA
jgi:hypothetical protein